MDSAQNARPWVWAIALCAGLFALSASAETAYFRLTTDHITVVSNGSAKRCGKLAVQFLTFERILRDIAGLDEDSQFRPLRVYSLSETDARRVFLSEADKRQESTRNMRIYSKYLPGADFNIAAIVDADGIDEPLQSVLLLYAESNLTAGQTRMLPPWYQIGVANITNGVLIRDDGSALLSRDGPFEPEATRSVNVNYDLAKLLATTARDLSSSGDWRTFSRRAREWAQFGLLTTADHRAQYRELATLMRQGMSAEDAANQAFGIPLAQLSKDFDEGRWRRQVDLKIPPSKAELGLPTAEHLESAQANTLLQALADRVAQEPARP